VFLLPVMRMEICKNTKFCFGIRCKNPVVHYLVSDEVKQIAWLPKTSFENHLEIYRILVPFRTFQIRIVHNSILIGVQLIFSSSYILGWM
jgi:hypothetical protein